MCDEIVDKDKKVNIFENPTRLLEEGVCFASFVVRNGANVDPA